jgi:predicted transcriptional regulator
MDGAPHPQDDTPDRPETAEARRQRLAWEAEQIDQAMADVAAGRLISLEAVEAWVDSWGTDHELPPPKPGQ